MSKKIFIFTTGRTGSVTLYNLFKTSKIAVPIHEGKNSDLNIKVTDFKNFNKKLFYDKKLSLKQDYTLGADSIKYLDKIYREREELFSKYSDKVIIDINPYQYMLAPYLLEKYPDAKFILLVRDGHGVVNSYYHRDKTTYPDITEDEYRGWAAGKPRPLSGSKAAARWKEFDRVQKTSWFWAFVNSTLYRTLKNAKDFSVLKTESLSSMTLKELSELFEISDVDISLLKKKHNRSRRTAEYIFENSNNLKKFNRIASKAMRILGYEISK